MLRFASKRLLLTAFMLTLLITFIMVSCSKQPTLYDPQDTFRFDTFGDEVFWTDTLRMNEVVQNAVDPATALAVGLKVDAQALPEGILDSVDLTDPATTVALLKLNAVVGLQGRVSEDGQLESLGVTCALCHSTVDDSVAPGIGNRLDGWPNRDLNPGLILSLSPFFDDKPDQRAQLQSWGAGYYDPYWNHDGISDPVLIPPAYGLKDVALETYSGEGPVSYWNAYVAITQMGGQGNFKSDDLGIDIQANPDLVTPKLPALRAYQFSLNAPTPPEGSYDQQAARRGEQLFHNKAQCATCHTGSSYTDASTTLHYPEETGMDPRYAQRGTTGQYRTTPLKGVWQHAPYFHDGSAQTLQDVINHYQRVLNLNLTQEEQTDLIAFLKSL